MKPRTKVQVISKIPDWPRASSLEPPVGIIGVVLGRRNNDAYGCAPDRIPVRFKGAEVGHDWEVDKGEDHEFIVYFMEPKYLALMPTPKKR